MEPKELVLQLRVCADRSFPCGACPFQGRDNCMDGLLNLAADYIEKTERKSVKHFRRYVRPEDAINADKVLFSPYVERDDPITWRTYL